MRVSQLLRSAVSLCLAITILGAHAARASAPEHATPAGGLGITGRVTVDGRDTITGSTFFSGGRIATADDSEATISLGGLGRVRYAPNSAGVLSFAAAATSGHLEGGVVTVSKPGGVSATFTTEDGTVAADAGEPAVFSIQVGDGGTTVSVQAGRAELSGSGGGRAVVAGESLTIAGGLLSQAVQRQNLSGRERAGLIIGIAVAVTLLTIIIAGTDEGEVRQEPCPITLSPIGDTPC